jgi:hypothetical protein
MLGFMHCGVAAIFHCLQFVGRCVQPFFQRPDLGRSVMISIFWASARVDRSSNSRIRLASSDSFSGKAR